MADDRLTVWQLARLAECLDPDSSSTPGADFLRGIREACSAAIEEGYADEDSAHEIADSAVPIYTHKRWGAFVDIGAYEEDPSELGADASDLTAAAGVCLYLVAHRLASRLLEEAEEDEEA